jgi:hypothetical protein
MRLEKVSAYIQNVPRNVCQISYGYWLISNEKYYINMRRNIRRYAIIDGTGEKLNKYEYYNKLF